MEKTRTKTAGALAVTLAAGGVAGALLFTPTASGAQEDTSGDTPTTEESEAPEAARAEHRAEREARAAGLAEVLGISTDELRQARDDGQTIAEVAEANGVALETVTDHLVDEATERLEARIADVPERVEDMVNGEGPAFDGGGHHGPRGDPGGPDGAPDADTGGAESETPGG